MNANAEVLIALGDTQYIVKVSPAIPAGEIHIGRFAALDALIEATGGGVAAAPEPEKGKKKGGYKVTRVRAEETRMMKDWLHKNGHTLNKTERRVMGATFPSQSVTAIGSAIVGAALKMDPASVRRVRNAVMVRAGLLAR